MTRAEERAQTVARDLLASGAVVLRPRQPFVWASGIESPIYCDNRLTLSYPAIRRRITNFLGELVGEHDFRPDAVAGVATAGIPQATLLAEDLGLPLAYVRGAAKSHGRQNRIEGRLEQAWRVVVVEDLISTGGSSLSAVEALREAGVTVQAVISVFNYGLPAAAQAFSDASVDVASLATLDDLLNEAALSHEDADAVRRWREHTAA